MSLLWFLKSFLSHKEALQWWECRQSAHLHREAEKIKDGLLQESFIIRRSLERSLYNNQELSLENSKDFLNKIEDFHHSLKQLSERLFPAYIEDSLPLAIQEILGIWLKNHSRLKISIDLPAWWRPEPLEQSLIILKSLQELLMIICSEVGQKISIHICLKQHREIAELILEIATPNLFELISYSGLKNFKYLKQSFELLTSGQCLYYEKDLKLIWYFRW